MEPDTSHDATAAAARGGPTPPDPAAMAAPGGPTPPDPAAMAAPGRPTPPDMNVAPRRPRWVRTAVAVVVVFELAAAGLLVARDTSEPAPRPVARTTARPDGNGRAAALRTNAVDALLDRRARAIRTRDKKAFEATLDTSKPAFVARQRRMFDALRNVPIGEWNYVVDADDLAPAPTGYGTETWAPKVTLRYTLTPYDTSPTEADQFFTFVRRGNDWLVADDTDGEASGRRSARDIWDVGQVAAVRGKRALVLGDAASPALLREVARQADNAVPRVSAVWGTDWSQTVVVLVPRTQENVATIVGDGSDLTRVAAVAIAALPGGASRPVGNRVVVNKPNFLKLGPTGRRVVLAHEVTHVATRDHTGQAAPTWLVEGFADYVGYLGSGFSPRTICQELAAEVRAGRVPQDLPGDAEFEGSNERLAQAYEAAWVAVRLVAHRIGQRDLVTLYRRTLTEPVNAVIHDLLDLDAEQFRLLWRDYVRQTLG